MEDTLIFSMVVCVCVCVYFPTLLMPLLSSGLQGESKNEGYDKSRMSPRGSCP